MRRLGRWELLAVGSIVLAALIRFQGLGWESMDGDSLATIWQATKPTLRDVIYDGFGGDPPLFQVILRPWLMAFGTSDSVARVPAALSGVLGVVSVYFAGRGLVSSQVGAIAALALAVMPYHIFYSQQVRQYSLFSLVGLGTFYFLVRALKTNSRVHWVGYGVSAALLVHTHYPGLLLVGFQLLLLFVLAARSVRIGGVHLRQATWGPLLAVGLMGVLLLPLAHHLRLLVTGPVAAGVGASANHEQWGNYPTLQDLLYPFVSVFFAHCPLSDAIVALPAFALLGLIAYGGARSRDHGLFWPLVVSSVAPTVVFWIAGRLWGCWLARFLTMILPMVALALAIGIAGLRRSAWQWGAVCLLVMACSPTIIGMKRTHYHPEFREAAAYIFTHRAGSSVIVTPERAQAPLLARYYPDPARMGLVAVSQALWDQTKGDFRPEAYAEVSSAVRGHDEVWLVLMPSKEESKALEPWFLAQPWLGEKLEERQFVGLRVWRFRVRPDASGTQ